MVSDLFVEFANITRFYSYFSKDKSFCWSEFIKVNKVRTLFPIILRKRFIIIIIILKTSRGINAKNAILLKYIYSFASRSISFVTLYKITAISMTGVRRFIMIPLNLFAIVLKNQCFVTK